MTHELKTWPPYFNAILGGLKTFEVRKADRPFAAGDILHLREWEPGGGAYTGRDAWVIVSYMLPKGAFVGLDLAVMAIIPLRRRKRSPLPQPDNPNLSPRQSQIVKLIGEGLNDKEVSIVLGVSHQAIRNQLHAARRAAEK